MENIPLLIIINLINKENVVCYVSRYLCVCVYVCIYMMKLYYDTQSDFQFGSESTARKPIS